MIFTLLYGLKKTKKWKLTAWLIYLNPPSNFCGMMYEQRTSTYLLDELHSLIHKIHQNEGSETTVSHI